VNPSKILSVAPLLNSDPPSVHVELRCSLCDELDTLLINLTGDLSWARRHDFYLVSRNFPNVIRAGGQSAAICAGEWTRLRR
jgi:hypothetical protein